MSEMGIKVREGNKHRDGKSKNPEKERNRQRRCEQIVKGEKEMQWSGLRDKR